MSNNIVFRQAGNRFVLGLWINSVFVILTDLGSVGQRIDTTGRYPNKN